MTSREPRSPLARDPFLLDEGTESGGLASPLDWAKLVGGALRRRWPLALLVFLPVLVATAAYYRVTKPLYRVEAKIMTQRPRAILPGEGSADELPSHAPWDLVHRRDNLVALVQQAGLLHGEVVDDGHGLVTRLLNWLRPPEVEKKEEPIDLLVRALDKRLVVAVEEGTILVRLDWPNAQHAYQLVEAAVQSFLEGPRGVPRPPPGGARVPADAGARHALGAPPHRRRPAARHRCALPRVPPPARTPR
jgi:hypothetical protein